MKLFILSYLRITATTVPLSDTYVKSNRSKATQTQLQLQNIHKQPYTNKTIQKTQPAAKKFDQNNISLSKNLLFLTNYIKINIKQLIIP